MNATTVLRQSWQKVFGTGARSERPPVVDASHGTILYLEDITVSFDGFKALDSLTLYIDLGELRCIIGPNGAGKTTMMDVITGKTRPDSGSAWFGQTTDLLTLTEPAIAQIGIGRKFQKPTVFEQHTVLENLELAVSGNKSLRSAIFKPLLATQRVRVAQVLETVQLQDWRDQPAGVLSHGQKQWLEIGMLLVQDPQLLLVDEPVAGMTPQEVERTAQLLTSLAGRHSVVVVEHDMDFVRSIAKQVTVLHEGSVLAQGTIEEVQSNERVAQVYLGE